MELGADLNSKNSDGCDAALVAAWGNQPDFYDYLIQRHGFDKNAVDNFGNNALHLAAMFNCPEMCEHLITNHSFNFDATNNFGRSAVWAAAKNGHEKIVKRLVGEYSADYSRADNYQKTPENVAISNGHSKISDYLKKVPSLNEQLLNAASKENIAKFESILEQGAQLNARDKLGNNAAILAASRGQIEMYDYLIHNRNLDKDSKNAHGLNAIFMATYNKQKSMVEHLVDNYSVDLKARDSVGNSLQDIARMNKNNNLADYLEWQEIKDRPEPSFDEKVSFISPPAKSKTWIDSSDPTFYYTFQDPRNILGCGDFRNTDGTVSVLGMDDKEKNTFRTIVNQEALKINAPIKEIELEDNEIRLLRARDYNDKPLNNRKIIFVRRDTSTAEELYNKGKDNNNFRPASTYSFDNIEGRYSYKVISLAKDLLVDHPNWGKSLLLHEFFGHAIGDLKHPNKYEARDLPPFYSKGNHPNITLPLEETVMSYHSRDLAECLGTVTGQVLFSNLDPALPKFQECEQNFPKTLTEIDIAAINRGLNRTKNNSSYQYEQSAQMSGMHVSGYVPIQDKIDAISTNETTTSNYNIGTMAAVGTAFAVASSWVAKKLMKESEPSQSPAATINATKTTKLSTKNKNKSEHNI